MSKYTEGKWSLPHFANDDVDCECRYILSEYYAGSIATISVDNGIKSPSNGANDSPSLEEAKENAKRIFKCINACADLGDDPEIEIKRLQKFEKDELNRLSNINL